MRGERAGALAIAGAERSRNGGGYRTAHGAAGHRHGQDHCRKHQRHCGQRLDAEPADIGGLRDHHTGAGRQRDHVRPGEAEQRAQNRPVHQRASYRPRRRRQRTLLFIDRDFGDVGHVLSRAQAIRGAAMSRCANKFLRAEGAATCLARQLPIPPAPDAGVPCGSAFQVVELLNGPDQRRPTARCRAQVHADVPPASGSEPLEQPFQHLGAGAMIVGDVIHQLPALLTKFKRAF